MTVLPYLWLAASYLYLLHRLRRLEREHLAHLYSDHEHLMVTEDLMKRVAVLDGQGIPFVVNQKFKFEADKSP